MSFNAFECHQKIIISASHSLSPTSDPYTTAAPKAMLLFTLNVNNFPAREDKEMFSLLASTQTCVAV